MPKRMVVYQFDCPLNLNIQTLVGAFDGAVGPGVWDELNVDVGIVKVVIEGWFKNDAVLVAVRSSQKHLRIFFWTNGLILAFLSMFPA